MNAKRGVRSSQFIRAMSRRDLQTRRGEQGPHARQAGGCWTGQRGLGKSGSPRALTPLTVSCPSVLPGARAAGTREQLGHFCTYDTEFERRKEEGAVKLLSVSLSSFCSRSSDVDAQALLC